MNIIQLKCNFQLRFLLIVFSLLSNRWIAQTMEAKQTDWHVVFTVMMIRVLVRPVFCRGNFTTGAWVISF